MEQGIRRDLMRRIYHGYRILNIVDAYDIMTHSTVYKSAIPHEDAIDEIISCSGKQFDPYYAREFVKFMERA